MKNQYTMLRHGESIPNATDIIISYPENGIKQEFGLTQKGKDQVMASINKAVLEGLFDSNTIIYSSPFSRCKQTAQIVKDILKTKEPVHFDDRLQERYFGDFEKTSASNYQKVWDSDTANLPHANKVESVKEIEDRVMSLLQDLEQTYTGKKIILVSHGDVLQVLQISVLGKPVLTYRELPYLDNAELRELKS